MILISIEWFFYVKSILKNEKTQRYDSIKKSTDLKIYFLFRLRQTWHSGVNSWMCSSSNKEKKSELWSSYCSTIFLSFVHKKNFYHQVLSIWFLAFVSCFFINFPLTFYSIVQQKKTFVVLFTFLLFECFLINLLLIDLFT